jgi:hypothetical protein
MRVVRIEKQRTERCAVLICGLDPGGVLVVLCQFGLESPVVHVPLESFAGTADHDDEKCDLCNPFRSFVVHNPP